MRPSILIALALIVFPSTRQDEAQDPDPLAPVSPLDAAEAERLLLAELERDLQGCWMLMNLDLPVVDNEFDIDPTSVVGFLLVHGGYLSLEFHGVSEWVFGEDVGKRTVDDVCGDDGFKVAPLAEEELNLVKGDHAEEAILLVDDIQTVVLER